MSSVLRLDRHDGVVGMEKLETQTISLWTGRAV